MATLTEFKHDVVEKLQHLVTLNVLTVVTTNQTPDPSHAASGPYLLTVIDMLQGDIRCEVTEALLDDRFTAIRDAHAAREQQALSLVDQHIKLIEQVLARIEAFAQGTTTP